MLSVSRTGSGRSADFFLHIMEKNKEKNPDNVCLFIIIVVDFILISAVVYIAIKTIF